MKQFGIELETCRWCKGSGNNCSSYGPVPCGDCEGSGVVCTVTCPECGEEKTIPGSPFGIELAEEDKICEECGYCGSEILAEMEV